MSTIISILHYNIYILYLYYNISTIIPTIKCGLYGCDWHLTVCQVTERRGREKKTKNKTTKKKKEKKKWNNTNNKKMKHLFPYTSRISDGPGSQK